MPGPSDLSSLSNRDLWRLAHRHLAEMDGLIATNSGSERLRIAHMRLRVVMRELRMRGEQLAIQIRDT